MKIEINLDETRFKDVLDNELNAFSKDELHEIIRKAMSEYLANDEEMKKLFLVEKTNHWGDISNEPSSIFTKIISNVDCNPIFDEVKEKIKEYLTEEGSIQKMALSMFANLFMKNLQSSIFNDNTFINTINALIYQGINNMKNDGRY